MAVAFIAQKLGIKALVCMSDHVPQVKVNNIKKYGAEILMNWDSQDAAGEYCYDLMEKEGVVVIPPFDDKEIICGQGTIALEIIEDQPDIDTVLVPLSGGGLISGVTLGMKMTVPDVRIIGISQQKAAVMIESLKAGHPVEMPEEETLADSLLGGIGLNNQYTFEITRDYVDETAMVGEEQIADGIVYLMENHKVIAEGASCVGIAYALQEGNIRPGSNVAIVVTGCGIPMNQIKKIIDTNY